MLDYDLDQLSAKRNVKNLILLSLQMRWLFEFTYPLEMLFHRQRSWITIRELVLVDLSSILVQIFAMRNLVPAPQTKIIYKHLVSQNYAKLYRFFSCTEH